MAEILLALGKWQGNESALTALRQLLFQRIVNDERLQKNMNLKDVDCILDAISPWANDEDADQVAQCLAKLILNMLDKDHLRNGLNTDEISTLAFALSMWKDKALECTFKLVFLAVWDKDLWDQMTARDVANILYAIHKCADVEEKGVKEDVQAIVLCLANWIATGKPVPLNPALSPRGQRQAINLRPLNFSKNQALTAETALKKWDAKEQVKVALMHLRQLY